MMRARFPLLLLGLVFLASVSVSFGIAYWEKENPKHNKCLQSCNSERDSYRNQACHARCNLLKVEKEECEEGEKNSTTTTTTTTPGEGTSATR
uniref:Truncated beta-conglycinin alpha subunit n=1 Tax=Glycine max TaxID=3847 RepID=Q1XI23_SOYBN|nr:truncated beta-conglycinin alpha subunit [Glycine max]